VVNKNITLIFNRKNIRGNFLEEDKGGKLLKKGKKFQKSSKISTSLEILTKIFKI
jgi:hypothetical protein